MTIPGLTQDFDVGLLVIDTWVLFFIGLIFYLRREDMREGYPLISERTACRSKPCSSTRRRRRPSCLRTAER